MGEDCSPAVPTFVRAWLKPTSGADSYPPTQETTRPFKSNLKLRFLYPLQYYSPKYTLKSVTFIPHFYEHFCTSHARCISHPHHPLIISSFRPLQTPPPRQGRMKCIVVCWTIDVRSPQNNVHLQAAYGPWTMACTHHNFNGLLFQI